MSELISQIREFLRTEVSKEFEVKEKDDMHKLHINNLLIQVKREWSKEAGPQRIYKELSRYEPVFNEET